MTLSRSTLPISFYNGLKEAFDATRRGRRIDIVDQMFQGITSGNGITGAEQLRRATASSIETTSPTAILASATTLSTLNYSKAGGINSTLPDIPPNTLGAVLRLNKFPENFIKTNPQFNGATLQTNMGNTNYHSLQGQATLGEQPVSAFKPPIPGASFSAEPAVTQTL